MARLQKCTEQHHTPSGPSAAVHEPPRSWQIFGLGLPQLGLSARLRFERGLPAASRLGIPSHRVELLHLRCDEPLTNSDSVKKVPLSGLSLGQPLTGVS